MVGWMESVHIGQMDLKTFIQQSLTEILDGVEGAIAARTHSDPRSSGAINPSADRFVQTIADKTSLVVFDVAVTVSSAQNGEAKGGLQVLGVGVGGKVTSTGETSQVSRIQFTVPISCPETRVPDDKSRHFSARAQTQASSWP